ncbi:MAG TPA: tetratricopeptide repeat protein, partial [Longimicrobium sp.]|nr:tetratricopeptide repeat protein [Longimicrobium sp.]
QTRQEGMLQDMLRRNQALLDSLTDQNVRLRGDVANRLVGIERQLVTIQELTGQGQQQLTQLRQQLARREDEARRAAESPPAAGPDTAAAPAPADAQGMFDTALGALRRGSNTAARAGFEEFLRAAPGHRMAADAQYNIGEAYAAARNLDRAVEAYGRVVDTYPTSARAPAALLRIARIEAGRGNRTESRIRYNQIVTRYPRSTEVAEARRELAAPAPPRP